MAAPKDSVGVVISPPNFITADFTVRGVAPYVQLKFSEKAKRQLMENMASGQKAKKGKKREPRDFEDDYKAAQHISEEGWIGIPAPSFRNAMISACKIVGFHMTKGKIAVFVEPDGFDAEDQTPLVRIYGEPEMRIDHVRNQTGVVDLRVRAMFKEWYANVRIRLDADLFSVSDISNLLARAGLQVGIGEGRPDGKKSNGMGWGLFEIEGGKNE
jgi:hypothetical protein